MANGGLCHIARSKLNDKNCNNEDGRPIKVRPPTNSIYRHAFCFNDLDLYPITVSYEFLLDILKIYLRNKVNFVTLLVESFKRRSTLLADRHTDRCV